MNIDHSSLLNRFVSYVTIDTQSDASSPSCPSTEKQKHLGNLLVKELLALGLEDTHMDTHGYIYATLPSNIPDFSGPSICFCSHMDTSPDASGTDVKPIVHSNYDGENIHLPHLNTVLELSDHKELSKKKGKTVITTSGDTLLGADDKAGIAEIMEATRFLVSNPDILHAPLKILFTPDEEIGRGADLVDIEKLGADFGYTMDGSTLGTYEEETFSADSCFLEFHGQMIHPGFALGRLENALKIAGDFISALPKQSLSPETTSGREPFVHPTSVSGSAESSRVDFILRSFETDELDSLSALLTDTAQKVLEAYPNSSFTFTRKEQYRNMVEKVRERPEITEVALSSMKEAGLSPEVNCIRGGTDGSRLSFMGLPCPNIFAGGHAFHSVEEWVCLEDMAKASEVIVRILEGFGKKYSKQ